MSSYKGSTLEVGERSGLIIGPSGIDYTVTSSDPDTVAVEQVMTFWVAVAKAEGSAEGARQQAAVMETEAQGSRREETEERRGPRWYEAGLMRLGQGVAIAGLMWMLFLYLKRKK